MFGFIKRMLGGGEPLAQFNEDPFGRDPKPLPTAAIPEPVPPSPRAAPCVVLQRDEIIDARTRICGYRFSARFPGSSSPPGVAAAIEALAAGNVAAFAERRLALLPVQARDWLEIDHQSVIGPNTVFVLTCAEKPDEDADWSEAVAGIHLSGTGVALSGGDLAARHESIPDAADFLVVDFMAYSLAGFEKAIGKLKADKPKLKLIAENICRWSEYRYCMSHGVDFCIGPFTTAHDEERQSGEIGQSRLVLMEMLNQLRRDADLADLTQVAKRDPGVVVKLIAMANSPVLGLSQNITSIDQAIMVLGREQLYRWLAIGMFRAGAGSPRDEVLLELALARGRFLEVIGQQRHSKPECDELFLLGLLSLVDSLFGVPMTTVVERIHLSPALKEVLLNSSGPLGRYLMLAIAVEKGRAENVARLAEQLELSAERIASASAEAIAWAGNAVRDGA